MPILVLLIVAVVVGYFLGRSKYSKSIDSTYNSAKGSVSSTWNNVFGKKEAEPAEDAASEPEEVEQEPEEEEEK